MTINLNIPSTTPTVTSFNQAEANQQKWHNNIIYGNCLEVLQLMPSDIVDFIVTSPPYADSRKNTYGGIHPDKYVD